MTESTGTRPPITIPAEQAVVLHDGLRAVEIETRRLAEDNAALLGDNPLATAENAGANPALALLAELIAIVRPAIPDDLVAPGTLDSADLAPIAAAAPNMPEAPAPDSV